MLLDLIFQSKNEHALRFGTYPPGSLKLNIVQLSISRNTQLLLSKASTKTSSISLNTQLNNTQVEYLVKYSF